MTELEIDVALRWKSTAQTWLRKAVRRLVTARERGPEISEWLIGYEAMRLLTDVLSTVEDLVPLLRDEQADDVLERARALTDRLRAHRLAAKLERTDGRTTEEADAFREKAAALRERP